MPLSRLLAVSILVLSCSLSISSQDDISPELSSFLDFVSINYFDKLTDAEYNAINPAEWAWIQGKAFEVLFEWDFTNTNLDTQQFRMFYLNQLWEELQDYIEAISFDYSAPEFSDTALREALIHGFYGYDSLGSMTKYYNSLNLKLPIPEKGMQYSNRMPVGGRVEFSSYYHKPWSCSLEDYHGGRLSARGTYLERPSQVYTTRLYSLDNNDVFDPDVMPGEGSGGKSQKDEAKPDTNDPVIDDESGDPMDGLINGTWRLTSTNGYAEFSFNVSGKGGSFSAKVVKNGQVTKTLSGQLEGYRKDKGEYYQYWAYIENEKHILQINDVNAEMLNMDFLKSRWVLQRVR